MTMGDVTDHFDNVASHGLIPRIIKYSMNVSDPNVALWLSHIEGLYQACAQLHWNSLYTEDEDERDCLRNTLENMCRDLLVEQYMVRSYGHYAINKEFKVSFTTKLQLKETLYEYMQVLGLMT